MATKPQRVFGNMVFHRWFYNVFGNISIEKLKPFRLRTGECLNADGKAAMGASA